MAPVQASPSGCFVMGWKGDEDEEVDIGFSDDSTKEEEVGEVSQRQSDTAVSPSSRLVERANGLLSRQDETFISASASDLSRLKAKAASSQELQASTNKVARSKNISNQKGSTLSRPSSSVIVKEKKVVSPRDPARPEISKKSKDTVASESNSTKEAGASNRRLRKSSSSMVIKNLAQNAPKKHATGLETCTKKGKELVVDEGRLPENRQNGGQSVALKTGAQEISSSETSLSKKRKQEVEILPSQKLRKLTKEDHRGEQSAGPSYTEAPKGPEHSEECTLSQGKRVRTEEIAVDVSAGQSTDDKATYSMEKSNKDAQRTKTQIRNDKDVVRSDRSNETQLFEKLQKSSDHEEIVPLKKAQEEADGLVNHDTGCNSIDNRSWKTKQWVDCSICKKWRRIPFEADIIRNVWQCKDNVWSSNYATCDYPQEDLARIDLKGECTMNLSVDLPNGSRNKKSKEDEDIQDLGLRSFDIAGEIFVAETHENEQSGHLEGFSVSAEKPSHLEGAVDLTTEAGCAVPRETSCQTASEKHGSICGVCGLGGETISCDGNCKNAYHIGCLDPPLSFLPSKSWKCDTCKAARNARVESIWACKDGAAASTGEELYFVKWENRAHAHNTLLSEAAIMKLASKKMSSFKKNVQQRKALKWDPLWTEPHRVIGKRIDSAQQIEWFIKWKGLGYEQCTWEPANTGVLASARAKELIALYEHWCEASRLHAQSGRSEKIFTKIAKLESQPDWLQGGQLQPHELEMLNKLRECWCSQREGIVMSELSEERMIPVITFVVSLLVEFEIQQPVLVITSSDMLQSWDTNLGNWGSNFNAVLYHGSTEARKVIQQYEFDLIEGCTKVQIVVSTFEAIIADVNFLKNFRWAALLVDEGHRPKAGRSLFQTISQLQTNYRLIFLSEPWKNNLEELLQMLAFIDKENHFSLPGNSTSDKDENTQLADVKEKLSHHIMCEYKKEASSNFLTEFWVPVQMSPAQIHQYCIVLVQFLELLQSGNMCHGEMLLQHLLQDLRACCCHPYLVADALQKSIEEVVPPVEYLDAGIKASGKLQLVQSMLLEFRLNKQTVLILAQSGRRLMDILDDYLRQQFGDDSFERIEPGMDFQTRQASLQRFNAKDAGCFILLLDRRAAISHKLKAVDAVILYESDWNPFNDTAYLQRLGISSNSKYVKIYRLYNHLTIEERILVGALQGMILDHKLKNVNAKMFQEILRWGVKVLLQIDDWNLERDACADPRIGWNKISSKEDSENPRRNTADAARWTDHLIFFDTDEVKLLTNCASHAPSLAGLTDKLKAILSPRETFPGGCSKEASLYGVSPGDFLDEGLCSKDFWVPLLKDKHAEWEKKEKLNRQRVRKHVEYSEKSVSEHKPENAKKKKRKKLEQLIKLTNNVTSLENLSAEFQPSGGPSEGISNVGDEVAVQIKARPVTRPGSARDDEELNGNAELDTTVSHGLAGVNDAVHNLRVEQEQLLENLKPELMSLCDTLNMPMNVSTLAKELLVYVMKNLRISKENSALIHEVELSLCWIAAEQLNFKFSKSTTVMIASSKLGFEFDEELLETIFCKLKKQCSRSLPGCSMNPSEQQQSINESEQSQGETVRFPVSHTTQNNHIDGRNRDDNEHILLDNEVEVQVSPRKSLELAPAENEDSSRKLPTGNSQTGNSVETEAPSPHVVQARKHDLIQKRSDRVQMLLNWQKMEWHNFFMKINEQKENLRKQQYAECKQIEALEISRDERQQKLLEKRRVHEAQTRILDEHCKQEHEKLRRRQLASRNRENQLIASQLELLNAGVLPSLPDLVAPNIQESGAETLESSSPSLQQRLEQISSSPSSGGYPSSVPAVPVQLATVSEQCQRQLSGRPEVSLEQREHPSIAASSTGAQQRDHQQARPYGVQQSNQQPSIPAETSRLSIPSGAQQRDNQQPSTVAETCTLLRPSGAQQRDNQQPSTVTETNRFSRPSGAQQQPVVTAETCWLSRPNQQSSIAGRSRPSGAQQGDNQQPGIAAETFRPSRPSGAQQRDNQQQNQNHLAHLMNQSRQGACNGNVHTQALLLGQFPSQGRGISGGTHNQGRTVVAPTPAFNQLQSEAPQDPLRHEEIRLQKEIEKTKKAHEDEMTRLKKELEALKKKYEALLQDECKVFNQKSDLLHRNLMNVHSQRRLAEAFRAKDLMNSQQARLVPGAAALVPRTGIRPQQQPHAAVHDPALNSRHNFSASLVHFPTGANLITPRSQIPAPRTVGLTAPQYRTGSHSVAFPPPQGRADSHSASHQHSMAVPVTSASPQGRAEEAGSHSVAVLPPQGSVPLLMASHMVLPQAQTTHPMLVLAQGGSRLVSTGRADQCVSPHLVPLPQGSRSRMDFASNAYLNAIPGSTVAHAPFAASSQGAYLNALPGSTVAHTPFASSSQGVVRTSSQNMSRVTGGSLASSYAVPPGDSTGTGTLSDIVDSVPPAAYNLPGSEPSVSLQQFDAPTSLTDRDFICISDDEA